MYVYVCVCVCTRGSRSIHNIYPNSAQSFRTCSCLPLFLPILLEFRGISESVIGRRRRRSRSTLYTKRLLLDLPPGITATTISRWTDRLRMSHVVRAHGRCRSSDADLRGRLLRPSPVTHRPANHITPVLLYRPELRGGELVRPYSGHGASRFGSLATMTTRATRMTCCSFSTHASLPLIRPASRRCTRTSTCCCLSSWNALQSVFRGQPVEQHLPHHGGVHGSTRRVKYVLGSAGRLIWVNHRLDPRLTRRLPVIPRRGPALPVTNPRLGVLPE